MIKYLKRHQIDVEKYDACIRGAINSRIYAYSWYLDIVADNWDVLVYDDYEAVMPLPWRSKYMIKYVYPPALAQQLGVFSSSDISKILVHDFLNAIPKRFKKIRIQLNSLNPTDEYQLLSKINYKIDLNQSYDTIFNAYRKDRKKSLKKSSQFDLDFDNQFAPGELIDLYKKSFPNLNFPLSNLSNVRALITYCNENNYGFQQNVFDKEELVASAFFLKDNKSIYYLFGASSDKGKGFGATTVMLDKVLHDFSKSPLVFDFEGSTVKSIGSFYKSFGSEKETYKVYSTKRLF